MIYYTFITFYGRILLQIFRGVHWKPASNSTIIFILLKNFVAIKKHKVAIKYFVFSGFDIKLKYNRYF